MKEDRPSGGRWPGPAVRARAWRPGWWEGVFSGLDPRCGYPAAIPSGFRKRRERAGAEAQRHSFGGFAARLKPCPDTKSVPNRTKSSRRSFDSLRSLRMTDILYKRQRQRQRQKQPQVLRLPSVAQDDSFLGVIKNEKPSGEAIEPSYAPPSKEPSKRHPRIFSWTNTAPPSRE